MGVETANARCKRNSEKIVAHVKTLDTLWNVQRALPQGFIVQYDPSYPENIAKMMGVRRLKIILNPNLHGKAGRRLRNHVWRLIKNEILFVKC